MFALIVLLTAGTIPAAAAGAPRKPNTDGSPEFHHCMKQSGGVDPAMKECGADEIDRQNKLLNVTYKALKSRLPVRLQGDLLKSQRAWLIYRDGECAYAYDTEFPGSLAAIMYQSCEIRMTIARISDLDQLDVQAAPEPAQPR